MRNVKREMLRETLKERKRKIERDKDNDKEKELKVSIYDTIRQGQQHLDSDIDLQV